MPIITQNSDDGKVATEVSSYLDTTVSLVDYVIYIILNDMFIQLFLRKQQRPKCQWLIGIQNTNLVSISRNMQDFLQGLANVII